MVSIDPKDLPVQKLHQYLLGAIGPRPIAFASTVDAEGKPNLAPFSFFNVFSANPPILIFSPARSGRTNTTKDTYNNVKVVPEVVINAVIPIDSINMNFYQIITQMEPFGPDNMRPLFLAKNVYDTGYSKLAKEAHISFNITQGNQILKGIGYNMALHIGIVKSGKPFDVVFQLQLNEWQGTQTVQMQVLDLKESGSYNN